MFCICIAFLDPVYSLLIYLIHLSGDSRELFPPLLLATHHPRARLRLYPDRRRGRKRGSDLSENACAQPPTLFAQQGGLGETALPKLPASQPHYGFMHNVETSSVSFRARLRLYPDQRRGRNCGIR